MLTFKNCHKIEWHIKFSKKDTIEKSHLNVKSDIRMLNAVKSITYVMIKEDWKSLVDETKTSWVIVLIDDDDTSCFFLEKT